MFQTPLRWRTGQKYRRNSAVPAARKSVDASLMALDVALSAMFCLVLEGVPPAEMWLFQTWWCIFPAVLYSGRDLGTLTTEPVLDYITFSV